MRNLRGRPIIFPSAKDGDATGRVSPPPARQTGLKLCFVPTFRSPVNSDEDAPPAKIQFAKFWSARCIAYPAHRLSSFGMWLGFVPIPVSLEPGLRPPAKRRFHAKRLSRSQWSPAKSVHRECPVSLAGACFRRKLGFALCADSSPSSLPRQVIDEAVSGAL